MRAPVFYEHSRGLFFSTKQFLHVELIEHVSLVSCYRSKPHKIAMSPSVPQKSWMNMKEAAHYMKFSLGSYGWPYYIGLNNPVVAMCKLLPRLG